MIVHPVQPTPVFYPRRSGFTLTELLIVIAIVAVLVLIGFTATKRSMESARQTVCLSNLKSIGSAVFLYASDNNDNMPFLVTGTVEEPGKHTGIWQGDLNIYIPYPKTNPAGASGAPVPALPGSPFHCPSADKIRSWWGTEPDYAAFPRHGSGPGTQGVFSQNAWGSHIPPLKRALIERPERCMLVFDSCNRSSVFKGAWGVNGNAFSNLQNVSAAVPPSGVAPRHGYNGHDCRTGRFGVVFCDGHVESIRYGDPRLRDPNFVRAATIPY
jgi:prepilin-type N-terminal cleavage/methylation domain-containing protein/prepilin-type processing-associated H-X9-DG protein